MPATAQRDKPITLGELLASLTAEELLGMRGPLNLTVHGQRLRRLRLLRGRTQTQAGALAGMGRARWSDLERGARGTGAHPATVYKLACGVLPDDASFEEIVATIPQFATLP